MRSRRSVLASVLAVFVGLVVVPGVVAADSVSGQIIRQLNRQLLYMALPIAVLVEVILVYAVVRFRNNDAPEPTRENRQLEITWTVATGLVLLFVLVASITAFLHPTVGAISAGATVDNGTQAGGHHGANGVAPGNAPDNATEIVGVAEQWQWTFRYPETGATSAELVVPRDRDVYLYVTSGDVIHSIHVPALGLKQDAFPGQYNLLQTEAIENGTYQVYCAEFCGTNHANMQTTAHVVDPDQFDEWLADGADANATVLEREADGGDG